MISGNALDEDIGRLTLASLDTEFSGDNKLDTSLGGGGVGGSNIPTLPLGGSHLLNLWGLFIQILTLLCLCRIFTLLMA